MPSPAPATYRRGDSVSSEHDGWDISGSGPTNSLTDVPGVEVGHFQRSDAGYLSGTTSVLFPQGATAAVDVRGGGPGTRETDLLDPWNLVASIDGIVLTGGSAYGLDAAAGTMQRLEERGLGYRVGLGAHEIVPIVPAAVIFDLGRGGDFTRRPAREWGYLAAVEASAGPVTSGAHGAGTGAVVGGLKGGLGTASVVLGNGVNVSALVCLNASGSAVDPATGVPWSAAEGLEVDGFEITKSAMPRPIALDGLRSGELSTLNTTLAILSTDLVLDRSEAHRMAMIGHDGLARAIRPLHTYFDGDTVFATSTRKRVSDLAGVERLVALTRLFEAAARTLERAVVRALLTARSTHGIPSYREVHLP